MGHLFCTHHGKAPGPSAHAGWAGRGLGDVYEHGGHLGGVPAAVHRMEQLPSISSKLEIQF